MDIELLNEPIYRTSEKTNAYVRANAKARVEATFKLTNTASHAISDFDLGFPLGTDTLDFENQSVDWAQLQNLRVIVDGKEVAFEKKQYQSEISPDNTNLEDWSVWKMNFGEANTNDAIREVKLTYDIYSTDQSLGILFSENNIQTEGSDPGSAMFYYILHTGRGWKGNIGSTTVRVRVPSDIPFVQKEFTDSNKDVIAQTWDLSPRTFILDTEHHEIIWHFTDWEPTLPSMPFFGLPMEDSLNPNVVIEFLYPETQAALETYFKTVATAPLEILAASQAKQASNIQTKDSTKEQRIFTWVIGALTIGVFFGGLFLFRIHLTWSQ